MTGGDGRARPPPCRQGFAVLFTGLSGAGKSTLAQALAALLRERGDRRVTLLDGDVVRRLLSSELGFSREHRELNLRRIGFVAGEIAANGGIAVCAAIAPYADSRREMRRTVEAAGGFVEVHVATPLETCEARDCKGLYARARAGLLGGFTGIDDPWEPPEDPDVEIDMTDVRPAIAARRILAKLRSLGFIGVERVPPHLRRYGRVRQALADARALGASLSGLLEDMRTGVVQLDRRGRVAAANDCALTILRMRDGLRDVDGRLRATLPLEDRTLRRLVASAVPFPDGPGAGGSMTVSRERAASRLQLHVSPVGADQAAASEWGAIGALVLVIDPASRLRLNADVLGALLELTPAESYVAASLVEGRSAHAIAAETGRSVTTVKWHIRHIFAKHGLSGQADLVRLAMSLADGPGVRR